MKLKELNNNSRKMTDNEDSKMFLSIKADQNKSKNLLKKDRSHKVKNEGRAKFELVKKR